jgi:hypothetical protein
MPLDITTLDVEDDTTMHPEFRDLLLARQPDLEGQTFAVKARLPFVMPPAIEEGDEVDLPTALNELGDACLRLADILDPQPAEGA